MNLKLNPWPCVIIGYFVVFITGVVTWVSFAMRNEDQLVRKDYYDHEIKYQNQIDREARTATVKKDVQIIYDYTNQTLKVTLPIANNNNSRAEKASLHFYRPSDSKLDKTVLLNLDRLGSQLLSVADLQNGFWKARVSWMANGAEYYFEKPLMLYTTGD
ncbi:MAG: FixH family protein [Verrucomicrobiales bacterium]